MMRVLFLYPRTLDPVNSTGGVAEFLRSVTSSLTAHGVQSAIYASNKTESALKHSIHNKTTQENAGQVMIDAAIYNGPFIKPGFFVSRKKIAPVLALCEREKFDVIHAQGVYTAGFMARQISMRTGIPYVVTSHSDIVAMNSKRMRRGNVQRRCRTILRDAARVTHLTPMMEEVSHELWDTRHKSTVIGNGIDCQSWHAYTELPEKNYMLGIGRLERGKGFHILIDMYARLIQQGVNTSLIIAGVGSEEKNLFSQIEQLGLNLVTEFNDLQNIPDKSVIFTGYVRDDAKKRLIAQSQCILFATQPDLWEEAFGIVQLEAMAAGKPMIASDTNVTRYLQQTGMQVFPVDPANMDAWVETTARVLQDKALRLQAGKANLQAVAQFDWQPIAERYLSVYGQACKKD